MPGSEDWTRAYALVSKIEIDIANLTNKVLCEKKGADWFIHCVPQKIREKCEIRRVREDSGIPVTAYIDLVDYKLIWKENWDVFGRLLAHIESSPSKSRSLQFIQEINPIRNLVSHPTKRLGAGLSKPTIEQLTKLECAREVVATLLRL